MKQSAKQIFIIGNQRSGTTLLRLMMNAHSEIAIPEDASFLMPLLNKKYKSHDISGEDLEKLVRYFSQNSWFELWNYDSSAFISNLSGKSRISLRELIDELYHSYAIKEEKRIWGDKTPSFFRKIDVLAELFPDAKFIHIVRDGRDVFNSKRKMDPAKNNPAVMALDWCYKLYKVERSFSKLPQHNVVTVRYEDMIGDTEKVLKNICSVVGIEYESGMMNYHKSADNYIGEHHSQLIFAPIKKENMYKWKKALTSQEINAFDAIAGSCLRKYGYEIGKDRMGAGDIVFLIKSLFTGLPRRIATVFRIKKTLQEAVRKGDSIDSLKCGDMPKNVKKDTH